MITPRPEPLSTPARCRADRRRAACGDEHSGLEIAVTSRRSARRAPAPTPPGTGARRADRVGSRSGPPRALAVAAGRDAGGVLAGRRGSQSIGTLSSLYERVVTDLSTLHVPLMLASGLCRAPMQIPWRLLLRRYPPSPRSSLLARRSRSGRSLQHRLTRSRSFCYRASNTGCGSGGTLRLTSSIGASSGENPPCTATTTSSGPLTPIRKAGGSNISRCAKSDRCG